jgi:hypothetical protein
MLVCWGGEKAWKAVVVMAAPALPEVVSAASWGMAASLTLQQLWQQQQRLLEKQAAPRPPLNHLVWVKKDTPARFARGWLYALINTS